MAFGIEIKRIRLESGLSGKQLAERVGVNADRLKQWELKDLDPRLEDRTLIENEFGMNLDEIKKLKKIPESILAPNLTGEVTNDNQVPTDFLKGLGERYKRGQRFSKIIGEIISSGTSLEKLRDEIFKVKGKQLSKMYLGIIPVPEFIIEILEEQFKVNGKYINDPKVTMFSEEQNNVLHGNEDNKHLIKYYKTREKNKEHKTQSTDKKSDEFLNMHDLFKGAEYVIKIDDDSMAPTYAFGCILGISEMQVRKVISGNVYVIEKEGEILLRRLFYLDNDLDSKTIVCISDNYRLQVEQSNLKQALFTPFLIEIDKLEKLFKITGCYVDK